MSSLINGSETWSPVNGGIIYGWTRDLRSTFNTLLPEWYKIQNTYYHDVYIIFLIFYLHILLPLLEKVRTNWPMEELFVIEAFQGALEYDQNPKHPITTFVNTPEEITNLFDPISYKKAASVLRMLNTFMTKYLFKKSLQHYLQAMRYIKYVFISILNVKNIKCF